MAKPSLQRLQEALTYDPATGVCHWKIPPRYDILAGSPAGHRHHKGNVVGIDGTQIPVRHLAWLFTHGDWPSASLTNRNKDKYDDRLENIVPRYLPWTDERDAKLKELWQAGKSSRQIISLLQCSCKSLNQRVAFLGLPPQVKAASVEFVWTDELDSIVRTLTPQNLYAVSRRVGCSQQRVERRAKDLGVMRSIVRHSEWPEKYLDIIREHWPKREMSAEDIGKLIGRSKGSIIGKARRLGLGHKPRPPVRTDTRAARRAARRLQAVARGGRPCVRPKRPRKPPPNYRVPERDGPKLRKEPTFFAAIPQAPNQRNITIDKTNAFTCMFVSEERADHPDFGNLSTYCGLPTLGGSWCPHHKPIVSAPTPRMLAEAA